MKLIRNHFLNKHIKKALSHKNNAPKQAVVFHQIQKVGLLIGDDTDVSPSVVRQIQREISNVFPIKTNVSTLFFTNTPSNTTDMSYFLSENISWNAHILSKTVNQFISSDFDVLINYFFPNQKELLWVSTLTKSKLNIGIGSKSTFFNDITIHCPLSEHTSFVSQMQKILQTLQNH